MITLATIVRFLCFDAGAIRTVASSRMSLLVGLLFVLSAGFAREYDGEYLSAQPWHLLLPLAASVLGCTAMALVVGLAAYYRGARDVGFAAFFLSLLSLYWMTAPMAWLYAIPVERFMWPADATRANLTLLGIVAFWRVALMVRCVQVIFSTRLLGAFVPVILFSDFLALLALRFVPGPIFMVMGGVRLSESEQVILNTRMTLGFWGVVTFPIWVIAYVVVCNVKDRWVWFQSASEPPQDESSDRRSTGVSIGTWVIVAASLLVWIPILPGPQREQSLRWQAEQMIHSGDYESLSALFRSHAESEFPPHWDPPPRIGYGEREPMVHEVMAGLLTHQAPVWIRNRYEEKLFGEARSRRDFWHELDEYSDDELDRYVELIARLDNSAELAKYYDSYTSFMLEERSVSGQRRKSLLRLRELSGVSEEPAEDEEDQVVEGIDSVDTLPNRSIE